MAHTIHILDRAFELARTGNFAELRDLKARLREEGYAEPLTVGDYLTKMLRDIMRAARPQLHGFG